VEAPIGEAQKANGSNKVEQQQGKVATRQNNNDSFK
jgi:hypothetical protein